MMEFQMPQDTTSAFLKLETPPLLILLLPFFMTFVGTPIAREIAIKLGIVDAPIEGSSKIHQKPIPYLGGLPLLIGIATGVYIVLHEGAGSLPGSFNLWLVLSALVIIFIVGLWDDVRGMIPGVKMSLLGVCGTLMFFGGARVQFIPDSWGMIGDIISWALTLFWFLGITNAANLMDNMNGLAAGTGIVAGLSIYTIALIGGDPVGIGLSLILVGALLGYLPYNYPKASIFFGDAGSMVLGFYLSFLGLMAGRIPLNPPDGFDLLSHTLAPIIVFGIFVFDTFFVAFSRAKRKINFWWGGRDHTSHRFVNYGFSKSYAAALVWILGAAFGGIGIAAKVVPGWLATILAILSLAGGIWFGRQLDKIPVENVRIGASNIREKKHQRGSLKAG